MSTGSRIPITDPGTRKENEGALVSHGLKNKPGVHQSHPNGDQDRGSHIGGDPAVEKKQKNERGVFDQNKNQQVKLIPGMVARTPVGLE